MAIDNIRLSQTARDQLITLKRRTGIGNWNILCRWALCRSLAEPAPPPSIQLSFDSSVEMSWKVFAGEYGEIYWGLMRYRCHVDGLPLDDETIANQFRLHLHRGIGYLVGDPRVTDVGGLAAVADTGKPAA
ncbi:DNA sulfur modification protein DndE [Mycolicibacterium elephantis]|uniref:DNA sulfur modification protein DndE n=1 Tax=Mycolicibacterium elephantis TaxID=81858 RepID=UPI0007E9F76C|nr:DNA sulfur modification protein DndE [Mycolicibacterium elephantis]OBB28943.1 DNA sulfur modification protein DndE [Mycolicibacterium elephantis]